MIAIIISILLFVTLIFQCLENQKLKKKIENTPNFIHHEEALQKDLAEACLIKGSFTDLKQLK